MILRNSVAHMCRMQLLPLIFLRAEYLLLVAACVLLDQLDWLVVLGLASRESVVHKLTRIEIVVGHLGGSEAWLDHERVAVRAYHSRCHLLLLLLL